MLIYQITISDITIEVEKKRIKNLRLTVRPPDGRVKITAPLFYKDKAIHAFVETKLQWILKHRNKYLDSRNVRQPENDFVSGESHYFLGNRYLLQVINRNKTPRIELHDKGIDLYIKNESSKLQRQKALNAWYRKQLQEIIPPLISKWEKIIGVTISEYGIKAMKTRWGSCNIRVKRIWLNLELAKKPVHCLEFIIAHELVHLLERNHNAKFKSYMDGFFPQWRSYKDELNKLPGLGVLGRSNSYPCNFS